MKNLKICDYKLMDRLPRCVSVGILIISLIFVITLLIPTSLNIIPVTIAAEPTKGIAENVIFVIIDGLRNEEAFDEPIHQYIPHMWNDLRPQGVINTNFWNTGITVTTSAHATIVTGVRVSLPNQSDSSAYERAKYPNIFEYYRKQKNVPKEKVWFITGKGIITRDTHHSLHPDYANFEASTDNEGKPDPDIWASVQQKMDMYHPSLLMINLRDVDHIGHYGVYNNYTNAVIIADQIVYDLWQKIQSDPFYKDKTDLIVSTDHGRNCDGFWSGFKNHGHHDHCNRHIMFLGIGPDFKQNQVVNTWRQQIDVAPTIGAILGFQTPYADGKVMTELFNDPNLGSDIITGGQRRISISASSSGLHAVWSQKSGEEWDIYYKKSQDGGNTWTQPIKLFENGQNNNYFYEAEITSQDNGLVYVVTLGYSLKDKGGDTYIWTVFGRRSLDGGNTWEDIQKLDNAKLLAVDPDIISRGDNILITFSKASLRSLYSNNRGANFTKYSIINDNIKGAATHSSIAADQNRFYVAWTHDRHNKGDKFYNVFFDKSYYAPLLWGADKAIASNASKSSFFMNNSITMNDSGLIRIAITKRNDTDIGGQTIAGKWKTLLKSSSNFGSTFTTQSDFYDKKTYEAWNPKISFIDPAANDFIIILEQHYNQNGAEIYGKKRLSSGWQDIFSISPLDSKDSAEPDLAIYNNKIYVGWQDYESGNWKQKVQKIN